MLKGKARQPLQVLQQADAALAGWSCPASTECCRFSVTGREPYVTRVEWELVAKEIARQGRKLPAIPDDDDGRCPFLSAQGRCGVYAARPLGCRTFYCERAMPPEGGTARVDKRALNALAQELADLSGEKGRPLRAWLAEALRGGSRTPAGRPSRRR